MTRPPVVDSAPAIIRDHAFVPRDLAAPWGLCYCGLAEAAHTVAALSYTPTATRKEVMP